MKRSDQLSSKAKITKVKTPLEGEQTKLKKPKPGTSKPKTSAKKKPSTSSSPKKTRSASASKTAASKKPSSTPSQETATTKKSRRGSTHHIGVKAKGKYVKNLYEVTKGKEGAARLKAINDESRRIQNLVNKRIAKLKKFEEETGITSPALRQLRESGYGLGATSSWKEEHLQQAEENYKAVLDFLKDKTSTITGLKENIKDLEKELHDNGWTGEHMTPDQYDMFKALAEKFYSESSKNKWYVINKNKDQNQMREAINQEIIALLEASDLDAALKMADMRLDELYLQSQRGAF